MQLLLRDARDRTVGSTAVDLHRVEQILFNNRIMVGRFSTCDGSQLVLHVFAQVPEQLSHVEKEDVVIPGDLREAGRMLLFSLFDVGRVKETAWYTLVSTLVQ